MKLQLSRNWKKNQKNKLVKISLFLKKHFKSVLSLFFKNKQNLRSEIQSNLLNLGTQITLNHPNTRIKRPKN